MGPEMQHSLCAESEITSGCSWASSREGRRIKRTKMAGGGASGSSVFASI